MIWIDGHEYGNAAIEIAQRLGPDVTVNLRTNNGRSGYRPPASA